MSDAFTHLLQEEAARKPWLYAEGESWWVVTGQVSERHTFSGCIARVVPEWVSGVPDGGEALFELLGFVSLTPTLVGGGQITHAKRLVFVMADEPQTTYYTDEQVFLEADQP